MQFESQCINDFEDGIEVGAPFAGKCLVEALTGQPGISCHLGHASGAGDIAERSLSRAQDVAVLNGVRTLLHSEGLTIKGVQKLHRDQGLAQVIAAGIGSNGSASLDPDFDYAAPETPAKRLDSGARDRLAFALDDLTAIKSRLDGLLTRA